MKVIKLFPLLIALLALVPSCKKCYTCQISGTPGVCTCYNGTDAGDTYYGTVAQANANNTNCALGGGYWQLTTQPVNASNNKYCYATGGPGGGVFNGAYTKEENEATSCENQGGTWVAD